MRDIRECEVCHRNRQVWVCASAFAPMSHAICTECLQKPAEPLGSFTYLLEDVAGGDPSKLSPELKNWYTWKDGKYVHWTTFVHQQQTK